MKSYCPRLPFPLKQQGKLLKGGLATSFAQLGCQGLRLGSNLVFAWLLDPTAFALMALVNGWIIGLQMVTDLGFAPALQRNSKWNQEEFQKTAYTIQFGRGLILFALSLIIAPFMANYFNMPELTILIYVASFSLIFGGATSIEVHLQAMRKQFVPLAIFEFKTQSQAVILGATLCYIWPSVLWLAAIPLFSSWFRMIESFLLKGSHRPEFKWDKDLGIDIIHFGMIVLLSSSLHFLSLHLDRFILAKLWTPDFLGVFVVGLALATAPSHLISHLCSRMLMPILATKRHLSNHELRLEILGWRKYFTFTLAPLLVIFYLLCQHFILSFYPLQYHDAAWIIPIMVIGLWPMILCTSSDPILYLRAHPWAPVIGNIYRCLHIIALPWVTSYYPEPLFALFWIAIRDVPFWICIQIALFRKGFSFLGQDVLASIWFFLFIILSHFISPITINSTTITSNTITSLFTEVFP